LARASRPIMLLVWCLRYGFVFRQILSFLVFPPFGRDFFGNWCNCKPPPPSLQITEFTGTPKKTSFPGSFSGAGSLGWSLLSTYFSFLLDQCWGQKTNQVPFAPPYPVWQLSGIHRFPSSNPSRKAKAFIPSWLLLPFGPVFRIGTPSTSPSSQLPMP